MGFMAFFVSVFVIRAAGRRMAAQKHYRPQITKILPPVSSFTPPSQCEI
jgi:uncharacterized membrane protein SirB2